MACSWQALNSSYHPWIDGVPPVYNKPVQGSYPNCLFVAALSSVGWINFDFIRNDTTYHDWTGPYRFTFWYSPNQDTNFSSSVDVNVNGNLNLDANGLLCGATSSNTLETWVGIYEKAYAKFRQWLIMKGLTPFPATSYSWPVANVGDSTQEPANPVNMTREHWGGNPMVVSAHLAGGVSHSRDVSSTTVYGHCAGASTDIYSIIKLCLCYRVAGKYGAKSNVPLTTWTNTTGTFAGTGLIAQHSYSVLGYWESGATNYLILRDTHVVDPTGTAIFTNGVMDFGDKEFNLPHFSNLSGIPGGSVEADRSISLSYSDGIFGIEKSVFAQYFQTVGWINTT